MSDLQIDGVIRGRVIPIVLDGQPVDAHEGESIASAMWRSGVRTCRITRKTAQPRGYYCGMGVCFECVVHVEGEGDVRSCSAKVTENMDVSTRSI